MPAPAAGLRARSGHRPRRAPRRSPGAGWGVDSGRATGSACGSSSASRPRAKGRGRAPPSAAAQVAPSKGCPVDAPRARAAVTTRRCFASRVHHGIGGRSVRASRRCAGGRRPDPCAHAALNEGMEGHRSAIEHAGRANRPARRAPDRRARSPSMLEGAVRRSGGVLPRGVTCLTLAEPADVHAFRDVVPRAVFEQLDGAPTPRTRVDARQLSAHVSAAAGDHDSIVKSSTTPATSRTRVHPSATARGRGRTVRLAHRSVASPGSAG